MPHFNSDPSRTIRRASAELGAVAALATGLALALGSGIVPAQPAPAGVLDGSAPGLVRDGLAPEDPAAAAALPAYLQARAARFVDWLADGGMLIATRFGQSEQIHRLRGPLAMREQLSFAPDGVITAAARPFAGDVMVYLQSRHGGDGGQLLLQALGDHAPAPLGDGRHHDGPASWAHDGKRIAFASDRGGEGGIDVYVLDTEAPIATAEPRRVVGGSGERWRVYDWSIDDRRLLLGRELPASDGAPAARGAPECEIYLADALSGELTPVAPASTPSPKGRHHAADRSAAAPMPAHARAARFASDGHGIVLLTNQAAPGGGSAGGPGPQFLHLSYTDVSGAEWRPMSLASAHDVERFDQSVDGRFLAYALNDGGISRLWLTDQRRKLDLNVNELPAGIISDLKFDPTGKYLALTIETARSPRDVYVLDLDTQLLTRWTQSEVGPLEVQSFVRPELLHFPTWDRVDGQARELSALVYRPLAAAAGAAAATGADPPSSRPAAAPRPVLILLCGGEGAQCRPGFEPFLQYIVNEFGAAVIAPNVRGSAGFGRSFEDLGRGALRDDAARDVGSLLVWIGLQHELDRNRVVLLGEGSGAYLALEALAEYGDRLLGGIVAFPPHLSPLANVAAIRRPVLLVQGLNNPAVPAYELEQLRSRLRVGGVDASYLAAADEGQDFSRKSNRDAYRAAAANFLAQLLR